MGPAKEVPEDVSKCSHSHSGSKTCSDKKVAAALKSLLKVSGTTPKTIVAQSMKKLRCADEECVLEHPRVKDEFGSSLARTALKPRGPKHGTEWLSDKNIFDIMVQWRARYPDFVPVPCQMRDFELENTDLAQLDIPALMKKQKRVGVVMNTDVSSGPGVHWYVLFMDPTRKPCTLEYFNSTGGTPQREIHEWMHRTRAAVESALGAAEVVNVCRYSLQNSGSECGVFSLWYLRSRLEGVSPEAFSVPDAASDEMMYRFRKYLFRPEPA